uniref:Uncharacterized protein n=1 Tax=Sphaerodactylus townsendi TaxID=933632 RepID=A0ACB8F138_9SAUR
MKIKIEESHRKQRVPPEGPRSECKPAVRGFTSSTSAVPAAGCSIPEPLSPSLIAEDEVFFGSMAEEREDNSSPEGDPSLANIHSSAEDLLSLDSALQGSEYYKDLGLAGPTEAGVAATAVTSDLWSLTEAPPTVSGPPPALEKACHYLDEDCACSCGSGRQHGFLREAPALQEGEEPFVAPVGSPPASESHNWGSLLPPIEDQYR